MKHFICLCKALVITSYKVQKCNAPEERMCFAVRFKCKSKKKKKIVQ